MMHFKELVPEGFKQYLKLLKIKFRHPGCFIGSPFVAPGAALGRGCSIARNAEVNEGVEIGDYSYLNCGAIVGSGRIGRFCSIGPYAMIGLPDHPLDYLSTSPYLYGQGNLLNRPCAWEDFAAPPQIGSDVWIGAFSVIRQGVSVGHGAVIGAGAVVIRNVEPYQIVAGVPAKPIRLRFDSATVDEMLRLRWWDRSTGDLLSMADRFLHPHSEWAHAVRQEVGSR